MLIDFILHIKSHDVKPITTFITYQQNQYLQNYKIIKNLKSEYLESFSKVALSSA